MLTFVVGKWIVDAVVWQATHDHAIRPLIVLVALEMIIALGGEVLARYSLYVDTVLGGLIMNELSARIMAHAAELDLQHFENAKLYDQMERARQGCAGRISLVGHLVSIVQGCITVVSLATAVVMYAPWLVIALVVAVVPALVAESHFISVMYGVLYRWTPIRRELDYIRLIASSDRTAKEVRMLGTAPWLVRRFRTLAQRYHHEQCKALASRAGVSAGFAGLTVLAYYGAYLGLVGAAAVGTLSVGVLIFVALSFTRMRDVLQFLVASCSELYDHSLYLDDLFAFLALRPTVISPPCGVAIKPRIQHGVVFEDVGFVYPGSTKWAVRHLDLCIGPRERIALVGENGAGKTTITKLLARLYDPTEGRILLDGTDLREYELDELRRAIAVIFQDYCRYDMRLDENIGMGAIHDVADYLDEQRGTADLRQETKTRQRTLESGQDERHTPALTPLNQAARIPECIRAAAEQAQVSRFVGELQDGYGQMLGRRFEGGIDLSGGQWQRVALARSYARSARIIILDEPTAALDARAEYDAFMRFYELTRDRLAVLISHRFSTVRMAERIVVLQDGMVTEAGTHQDLMKRDGCYAELFRLQARSYA